MRHSSLHFLPQVARQFMHYYLFIRHQPKKHRLEERKILQKLLHIKESIKESIKENYMN